jgi:hypothetical protein
MNPDDLFELISHWFIHNDIEVEENQVGSLVDLINDKLLTHELKANYPMATPLSSDSVTPAMVARSIITRVDSLQEIYVVGTTHLGQPVMWFSGDMQGMAFASLVFQDTTLKKLNEQYQRGQDEELQ